MSFNWRLLLAPPEILDYVVEHEVCHLEVMDHSPRFWRLLLAPPDVLDYVVEHEVCHLEVLDHSPRFWALLEARVPDWRDHARWLRRYGATLRL